MKNKSVYQCCIIVLLVGYMGTTMTSAQEDCEFLIWADEFETEGIADTNKWGYDVGDGCPWLCGWGNNEQQYYTYRDTSNARVRDGKLIIEARKESMGGKEYTSARLVTRDLFETTYGRIEISAKLPGGNGVWAALWMLGDQQYYGSWPNNGEIDIMEYVGHDPGEVFGTIHCLTNYGASGDGSGMYIEDTESAFHVYGIDWNPDSISFFVDDSVYHVYHNQETGWEQWPYDKPLHLIMNIAIGGNLGGEIDDAIFDDPVTMEIDYVRVYQQPGNSAISGPSEVVPGEANLLFTSLIPADKYIWEVPDGATIVSGQNNDSVWVNWLCVSDTLRLTLETSCDTVQLEHVIGVTDIELQGHELVHPMETGLVYSIPELTSGLYTWSFPDDVTPVGGTDGNEIMLDWGCSDGQVKVEYSFEGLCPNDSADVSVLVRSPQIMGPTYISQNAENVVFSIDSLLNSTYLWTVPEDVTITEGQGTTSITTNWGTNGGTVMVEAENACGTSSDEIEIMISNEIVICDFETTVLEFQSFGGSTFEQIENPFKEGINTSDNVGKTYKEASAMTWGGIYADLSFNLDFNVNNTITMKVYAPKAGEILFKLENPAEGTETEIGYDLETVNEWTTVSYNFSQEPADTYYRITPFFDFGSTDQDVFYFDDIILTYVEYNPEEVENAVRENVVIYPNPADDEIRIKCPGETKIEEIKMFTISGEQVLILTEYISDKMIPLKDIEAGIYILRVKTGKSVHTHKVLIR